MSDKAERVGRWLPAAQAGCPQALGQTLEACRRYLLWMARREIDIDLQAKGGASDLVQETFLEAQRDFAQFHGNSEAELLAWLRKLLLNNLSNFVRRYRDTAKRRVGDEVALGTGSDETGISAGGASPCDEAIERERVELLRQALDRLPEDYRRILVLWQQEERTFEEISEIVGCSRNTARARWLRAIKQLQQELQSLI